MPSEAGYEELRRLFDYCKDTGLVGPAVTGQESEGSNAPGQPEICVVDADDLLDDPEGIIRKYCQSVDLQFRPEMLEWDSDEAHEFAKEQFEKWDGFHDDAIHSRDLKPRKHVSICIHSIISGTKSLTRFRRKNNPSQTSKCTVNGPRNTAKKPQM